jgi:hypothetical protein
MENLAVEFYDSSTAAVHISHGANSPSSSDYRLRQYSDALIFANFALRMMRNLGKGTDTETLARMLSGWSYEPEALNTEANQPREHASKITALESHVIYRAAIEMGLPPERAMQLYGCPVFLVPHSGKGRKRFLGTLTSPQRNPRFKLKTKGFGLAGKGIPQYGTDSFFVLLVYLAEIHNSPEFLAALKGLAGACGSAHLSGEIRGLNCESLAHACVNEWFGGLIDHLNNGG